MNYFLIIGKQIVVVLMMLAVGFFCGKKKILDDRAIAGINQFVMVFVMACTAIAGFQIPFSMSRLGELGKGYLVAVFLHFFNLGLSLLVFRKRNRDERNAIAVSSTLTNAGFIGYPMMVALIGSEGIFYGLPHTTTMGVFAWTVGVALISGDRKNASVLKVLKTPAIIGTAVGFVLFLLSIKLPEVLHIFVDDIAAMNMPLPVIIIGYFLSKVDLKKSFRKRLLWEASAFRLVVLPVIGISILYLMGLRGNMLLAATIADATPPAAIVTILAASFHKNTEEMSELVSFETVISALTLPLIAMLVGALA